MITRQKSSMEKQTICIRLPKEIIKKLDRWAKKEGMKRSQLIRKLIITSLTTPSQNEHMSILILNKKIKALADKLEKLESRIK